MRVLFAAGGTGGHVYPAIAIADALRVRSQIRFIGSSNRLERTIVPQAGYPLETVASRPLSRGRLIGLPIAALANLVGMCQAARALLRFSPDIVIATGGYVCFPVVAAARILRGARLLPARLALLEPNARPGLTNRLLGPMVDEVWGAFDDPGSSFSRTYVHTGVPVRSSLMAHKDRAQAAQRLGISADRHVILVIGGSQGARSLNQAVANLVTRRALPADWQIVHLCGRRDYEDMRAEERTPFGDNRVTLFPYLSDMSDAYAVAHVAVARAGASTLGELAALGIPSILVPYPFATENHQLRNARAFERAGAAVVIEDRDLSADSLWWALRAIMEAQAHETYRRAARSLAGENAVTRIVARIDALLARKT